VTAIKRGVAHLFLVRVSASHADLRQADEVSRPDYANPLPAIRRPYVRSVSAVGSPMIQVIRGSLSTLGRVDSVAET